MTAGQQKTDSISFWWCFLNSAAPAQCHDVLLGTDSELPQLLGIATVTNTLRVLHSMDPTLGAECLKSPAIVSSRMEVGSPRYPTLSRRRPAFPQVSGKRNHTVLRTANNFRSDTQRSGRCINSNLYNGWYPSYNIDSQPHRLV